VNLCTKLTGFKKAVLDLWSGIW